MRLTVNKANFLPFFILFLLPILISSCSVLKSTRVKSYPINKPFVYENKVVINGDISKDEKNRLTTALDNYWDDSLTVRTEQKFGFFYTIKNPPVFAPNTVTSNTLFSTAYLTYKG